MITQRIRLSVGPSGGQRIVAVVVGLLFAAVGTAFVLLPLIADGLLRSFTGTGDACGETTDLSGLPADVLPVDIQDCLPPTGYWGDAGYSLGPLRFIGFCGLPFALLGLYLALRSLRTAVWLEGTRVEVRGGLVTRSVDLSTAEIIAGAVVHRYDSGRIHDRVERVPTLIARDPVTGRKATIALHGNTMTNLPPHELRALADAITANRSTDGRNGDAHTIARQLRAMADNPLAL